MRGFSGAVNAPVGEGVAVELLRRDCIVNAADIEAAHVQRAVIKIERQEGKVVVLADQQHERLLLALEIVQMGEVRMSAGIGVDRHRRLPVATDDFHPRIGDGFAAGDGLHEYVLASVHCFLGDDADVGDQNKAYVRLGTAAFFRLLGIIALQLDHKYAAASAGFLAQVFAKVDIVVSRLAVFVFLQRTSFVEAFHQCVQHIVVNIRRGKSAVILVHQMMQLVGQQTPNLNLHAFQAARHVGQLALAGKRQQRSLRQQLDRLRIGLDIDRGSGRISRLVAAKSAHTTINHHIQRAPDRRLELVAVHGLVFACRRECRKRQRLRLRQHVAGDIAVIPVVRFVALIRRSSGLEFRQQPGMHAIFQRGLAHHGAGSDDQHLFRLEALVIHQRHADIAKIKAVQAGHDDVAAQLFISLVAATAGTHTFAQRDGEACVLGGNRQRGGVDISL